MDDEKDVLNRIQFLYERRMILFNARRDHEWKIFFGVITLLVALDAAHLIYRLQLEGWHKWAWAIVVAMLTGACILYEWGLQRRNFFDRAAMNVLYNKLCEAISLPAESVVREPEHSRWKGCWAFIPQALVLLTVFSFSAVLPWLSIKAGC